MIHLQGAIFQYTIFKQTIQERLCRNHAFDRFSQSFLEANTILEKRTGFLHDFASELKIIIGLRFVNNVQRRGCA
ncbi:MAG: hypothetical protein WCC17_04020 [Candidatus Nitrosopolaris sp.]